MKKYGLFIVLFVLCGTGIKNLPEFFDIPSALCVIGCTLIAYMAGIKKSRVFALESASYVARVSGIITAICGFIRYGAQIDSYEIIIPFLAVMMIPIFYGLVISMILELSGKTLKLNTSL